MFSAMTVQFNFIIRLVIAGLCGAFIGYERKNRMKEAGIRTHLIVALGSALIMIISKYGFDDLRGITQVSLDPSRVAAQIVSGIGFLGAGMIFVRRQMVNGLTTAAGVWTTAGVGMAIGSGMYIVGLSATVLIILSQIILHGKFRWLRIPLIVQMNMKVDNEPGVIKNISEKIEKNNIQIMSTKIQKIESEKLIQMEISVRLPMNYPYASLIDLFANDEFIRTIEF